jgi:hypothetical protein
MVSSPTTCTNRISAPQGTQRIARTPWTTVGSSSTIKMWSQGHGPNCPQVGVPAMLQNPLSCPTSHIPNGRNTPAAPRWFLSVMFGPQRGQIAVAVFEAALGVAAQPDSVRSSQGPQQLPGPVVTTPRQFVQVKVTIPISALFDGRSL